MVASSDVIQPNVQVALFVPGISRDNWHKRRKTGGKRKPYHKKRKYELGRPPANTKVGTVVGIKCVFQVGVGDEHSTLGMSFFWAVLVQIFELTNERTCHSYTDTLCKLFLFPDICSCN